MLPDLVPVSTVKWGNLTTGVEYGRGMSGQESAFIFSPNNEGHFLLWDILLWTLLQERPS